MKIKDSAEIYFAAQFGRSGAEPEAFWLEFLDYCA